MSKSKITTPKPPELLPVEVFDSESGEFRPAGMAKLLPRDRLLLQIGRYLEQRTAAKTKLKLNTEAEEEMIDDLKVRLDGDRPAPKRIDS